VILFLLACGGEKGETSHPYLLADDQPADAPRFESDAVGRSIEEAIAVFQALDPAPVIAAYDAAMTHADGGCPAWYTSDGMPFWYDDCTTEDGTTFDGYGYEVVYDGTSDGYATYTGTAIGAVASIQSPNGDYFTINGVVYDLEGVVAAQGTSIRYTEMSGDIAYSGNPNPGIAPTFRRTVYELVGGVGLQIDGSVSGLSGELEATAFDDVYLVDEATGMSDCSDEPSGVISVLDAGGDWIDLVFDPEVEDSAIETDAGRCDGCAAAWWGSTYLGQACADFSPWLAQ
jgi:hypothetical protein